MARVLGGKFSVFVIDLGMISLELHFLVFLINNLIIFVSIHTGNDHAFRVILVVRDLVVEFDIYVTSFLVLYNRGWYTCDTDVDFCEDL